MKNFLIVFAGLLLVVAAEGQSGSEPSGYRGFEWGLSEAEVRAEIDQETRVGKLKPVRFDCRDTGTPNKRACIMRNMLAGKVPAVERFVFFDGKFVAVEIEFPHADRARVFGFFRSEFGPPTADKSSSNKATSVEALEWNGKTFRASIFTSRSATRGSKPVAHATLGYKPYLESQGQVADR